MIDHQVVIRLIQTALDGIPAEIPVDFPLSEYLLFARQQQIEALIITGLLKADVQVPRNVRNFLLQSVMVSSQQMTGGKRLFTSFQEQGIDYLPLKGCVLKPLYPSDELRSMGDIDVLVKTEQYDRIRPIMLDAGFQEIVESDHEYVWDKPHMHVELHKRLIPSYNKDYFAYYGDGWQLARPTATPHRFEMTHEDTFIYIFTHYAKHYRDAGVGIRQALDLYVYRKAYPHMDKTYILQTLTCLQLNRFYENTMHMLDVWFGDAEHTEASQLIADRLFASGVFGTHENSLQSTMLKKVNRRGNVQKVKILNWFHRVFPAYSGMRQLHPVLNKWPILLPAMWIARWGNVLLHKRDKFKQYVTEDQMLDDASVEEYHKMLKKSGLDFNFK